jgi:hypothetical protein
MSSFVRTILVWLMVYAMSAQGMAASFMLFCGPDHDHMMLGWGTDLPDAGSGDAVLWHSPDQVPMGQDLAGLPLELKLTANELHAGVSAGVVSARASHHGDDGCSACAACCSALPLMSSFTLPEPWSVGRGVHSTQVEPLASLPPDPPDPPPRPHLA